MSRHAQSQKLIAAACAGATLLITGCSTSNASRNTEQPHPVTVTVANSFIPKPINGNAGGFMIITNESDTVDKLLEVKADISDDVQLHETRDGKMQSVRAFDIPAANSRSLSRGGDHVMFMNLKRDLNVGDNVQVHLIFEKSGPVDVTFDVRERTSR
ncbi:copper chaperone PCu(A)C (plasmid) [Streptomyces sp. JL4002]|uniref:copper chaperone PCu(A)C n=1 Tax=Streptomyces sp. JL4002 TaxID=3404781 RepID=UPI003B27E9E4